MINTERDKLINIFAQYGYVLFAQDEYRWLARLFGRARTVYLFTKTTDDKQHITVSVTVQKGIISHINSSLNCIEHGIFQHLLNMPVKLLNHSKFHFQDLVLLDEHLRFFDYQLSQTTYYSDNLCNIYSKTEGGIQSVMRLEFTSSGEWSLYTQCSSDQTSVSAQQEFYDTCATDLIAAEFDEIVSSHLQLIRNHKFKVK